MSACQVNHMDIVTHTRTVGGVVIIAENAKFGALSNRYLGQVGHEIVGNTVGIFAYQPAWMRTYRVEVSQKHHVPLRIGFMNIGQDLLQHTLGPAVGVGTYPFGALLGNGNYFRISVNRCTR